MPYTITKVTKQGLRYTAMYYQNGRARSAGTYSDKAEAQQLAEMMEARKPDDPRPSPAVMATMTIKDFVPIYLRLHDAAPGTKRGYASVIHCHITPYLGSLRVREITMQDCRTWLVKLRESDLSPAMQRSARVVFSGMMTMAIADGYRDTNPVRGLKTPRQSHHAIKVMTVEQFESVFEHLPTHGAQVMARLAVSTGMRFGEMTALQVGDINMDTRVLEIAKAVTDVGAEWNPTSKDRFIINPYTKDYGQRTVKVPANMIKRLQAYIDEAELHEGDLLFPSRLVVPDSGHRRPKHRPPLTPERIAELGTFLGPNGCTYSHGTINGYITGKCHCDWCRQASTEYSAARKRARQSKAKQRAYKPRQAVHNPQGLLGRDSWGRVWKKAVKAADLPFSPTAYQVRHTNASWLIKGGTDPKTVMHQLGQKDLRVTSRYVQIVDDGSAAADLIDDLLD